MCIKSHIYHPLMSHIYWNLFLLFLYFLLICLFTCQIPFYFNSNNFIAQFTFLLFKINWLFLLTYRGFLSGSEVLIKESSCQSRRYRKCGFNHWVRKIPWRRKWLSTPVFLPGKSHEQRSLAGYSPWGGKESNTTEQPSTITTVKHVAP